LEETLESRKRLLIDFAGGATSHCRIAEKQKVKRHNAELYISGKMSKVFGLARQLVQISIKY
jgi:hypothetical protein